MKIAAIRAWPVAGQLTSSTWTAYESLKTRYGVLIEVATDDGPTGYGIVNQGPVGDVVRWVDTLAGHIVGMDAERHQGVWETMFLSSTPRPGAIGERRPPPVPRAERTPFMAALGGIDIALWDIKGKAAGRPVWALLGGSPGPVKAYITGGYYEPGDPPEACGPECAERIAEGFRAIKLKSGFGDLDFEVRRLRTAREAVGPDIEIMMDLTGCYSMDEAIAAAHAFAPYDVTWLEEPLHWYYQPVDYARLAQVSPIPLAQGERELHRFSMRDYVAAGGIRYMQFDVTRAAGFTEGIRVSEFAAQNGVLIAPHAAHAIHCHLVAGFPRDGYCVEYQTGNRSDPVNANVWTEPPTAVNGALMLSEKPGFGLEPNWDWVKANPA